MNKCSSPQLKREDFSHALNTMDTFIDISVDDLLHINRMARKYACLRQVENMRVSDIMTSDVVTVRRETTLQEAAELLLSLRISGLPVVDDNNQLIGIVTEADFLTALGLPVHHANHSVWQTLESIFSHAPEHENMPSKVADIMSSQVVTIDQKSTLHDVIEKMNKYQVKRLVVTDTAACIQGIITRSSLIQVMLKQLI